VAAVGYDETWRWRMAGGANSVAEHREWWSRVVAGVAARGAPEVAAISGAAPVAALHELLGAPSRAARAGAPRVPFNAIANLLGALALASLLVEWMLRRARGAR
jgi:hypothetical protein